MEEAGKAVYTGGSGHPGVSLILWGGGSVTPGIRVGVLGNAGRDDAGDGGIPSGFPK